MPEPTGTERPTLETVLVPHLIMWGGWQVSVATSELALVKLSILILLQKKRKKKKLKIQLGTEETHRQMININLIMIFTDLKQERKDFKTVFEFETIFIEVRKKKS